MEASDSHHLINPTHIIQFIYHALYHTDFCNPKSIQRDQVNKMGRLRQNELM